MLSRFLREWSPLGRWLVDGIAMVLIEEIVNCCFCSRILVERHKVFKPIEEVVLAEVAVAECSRLAAAIQESWFGEFEGSDFQWPERNVFAEALIEYS